MAARLIFRIVFDGGIALGHGKLALLEAVERTGSISAAAREMGMSYRRAWVLIDDLNQSFRAGLVHTSLGGKAGGGAALTDVGREVVRRYRAIEKKIESAALPGLAGLGALIDLGHKTSAVRPPKPRLKPRRRGNIRGK